jgi:hypothetical protein
MLKTPDVSEMLKQNIELFIKTIKLDTCSNVEQSKQNRAMLYKLIDFAVAEGRIKGIQESIQ